MQPYSALVRTNPADQSAEVVFLKDGFSWSAFFFSGLWFLYHRMWKEFLALAAANIIIIIILAHISSDFDLACLEIAFIFLVALNANYWRAEHLKKEGYEFVGMSMGNSDAEASLRFYDQDLCKT
ncbi:MAG: DUF2628 domain-containing protein [Alphaproteobacteria bacterium]|nr:DUF2628 domain-containing protein [Alphaproteobacteria bacterium]